MTWEHNRVAWRLGFRLQQQLDLDQFEVRVDAGHVRRSETEYFIPDVMVIPLDQARATFTAPGMTALYPWPLPLVVEVWSPSTGGNDMSTKLPEYQRRGDAEIWLFHVRRRVLTAWVSCQVTSGIGAPNCTGLVWQSRQRRCTTGATSQA